MLKRLLAPLLTPLVAKLEKLQDRTTRGFKHVESQQADAKQKTAERLNMLSRQVDEARDEFHRGFRIQQDFQASLQNQLNEALAILRTLQANQMGRVGTASTIHAAPLQPANTPPQAPEGTLHDSMVEMMLSVGRDWLNSQGQRNAVPMGAPMPQSSGVVPPARTL